MAKKTCGEFYRDAIREYGKTDAEYWAFATGFVHGQAEKVYLGACMAAMFRPSDEKFNKLLGIVERVCRRYGLRDVMIDGEIWICRPMFEEAVRRLMEIPKNSHQWHGYRAKLCGIPKREVDLLFHERQGYGQDCDK